MSAATSIEWTDRTWNPVRGCTRVSEGCRNCYAERMAARGFTWSKGFASMTAAGPRWTGKVALVPELLDEPLRWRKPQRVFVNSMSDLFHEALGNEEIAQVFHVMYGEASASPAPRHTYQILTKRPARMLEWFRWLEAQADGDDATLTALGIYLRAQGPHPRVWLGVSVEDQATADERIPLLLQTPAAVRFVSYEPALGPVDFRRWVQPQGGVPGHCVGIDGDWWHEPGTCAGAPNNCAGCCARGLDWIIVGGESGPGARPFDVEWARSTVRQCRAADVPVFVKQMGGYVCDRNDRLALDNPPLDKTWWPEPKCSWDDGPRGNIERDLRGYRDDYQGAPVRIKLQDRKGGDPSEWPEDLRVREFPEARA